MPESLPDDEAVEPRRPADAPARASALDLTRRTFVQALGAGLLISVAPELAAGRQRGGGRPGIAVAARIHFAADGAISVMTGKVEEGQGARAQLTQAAAEELRVPAARVRLIMADSELCPDDGITAGSRTTPYTVPAVRRGAVVARELLRELAAEAWGIEADTLTVRNGEISHPPTERSITYGELARAEDTIEAFQGTIPPDIDVSPVDSWEVLGTSFSRPNLRDLVTAGHRYPSDVQRPGMLYGRVLRAPAYDASLESVDLSAAQAMAGVVVVRDGELIGVAAPSSHLAGQALEAVDRAASWTGGSGPASEDVHTHLRATGRASRRSRPRTTGSVEDELARATTTREASYRVAYIQHAPMETRAAVAEWEGDRLTVWAGVDWPQRVQGDLARALEVPEDAVRVIVPDMGGGFGGKHTGEAAEEAARLSRAAGRPVSVHWTRAEEFTWAYFRPAAVIDCRAGLDATGSLVGWDFTTINPGSAGSSTPYAVPGTRVRALGAESPLRQGPYRCLGATANNFARESFMDELAEAAGADPLAFRLAHLEEPRLRAVLVKAAEEFGWPRRGEELGENVGVGLACGTEKNSVVAACVEVEVDLERERVRVRRVCEAFECGPIQNPANLLSQVQGCIVMGIGGALREEMRFADGRILNPGFDEYLVPRFADVPELDVHLLDRPDIPSAGGGETPIIAVAPAIAGAIRMATGRRIRSLPLQRELFG